MYDLFVLESLKTIGNDYAFGTKDDGTPSFEEERFRTRIVAKMSTLIEDDQKVYKTLFGFGTTQIIVDANTTKSIDFQRTRRSVPEFAEMLVRRLYGRHRVPGNSLKPDILIHQIRTFNYQHMICEVKVNEDMHSYVFDICKLLSYIHVLHYRKAYFIFTKQTFEDCESVCKTIADIFLQHPITQNNLLSKLQIVFPTCISNNQNDWTCIPFSDIVNMHNRDLRFDRLHPFDHFSF